MLVLSTYIRIFFYIRVPNFFFEPENKCLFFKICNHENIEDILIALKRLIVRFFLKLCHMNLIIKRRAFTTFSIINQAFIVIWKIKNI